MKRLLVLCLLAGLLATPVHAKFVPFGRATGTTAAITASGAPEAFTVDVTVPGIDITTTEGYVMLRLPDQAITLVKDQPELPLLTFSVVLPAKGMPEARLVDVKSTEIKLDAKVLPSRGFLLRNVDPSTIALVEGAAYGQDSFADFSVEIDNPYIVRDLRGTAVRISPVSYNPVKGVIRVLTSAKVEIRMVESAVAVNELAAPAASLDADFAPVYKRLFVNFASSGKAYDIDETAGRAVVICPDQFAEAIQPLLEWRATKGLDTKLTLSSQISGSEAVPTAAQVQAYIKGEYEAGNLTWVHLVGDADTMPTLRGVYERAASDACYVKLAGDDNIPDAFISRFSAKTAEDVAVQVARTVAYEKNPVTGEAAAFYTKGTGIASAEGNPTDYARAEELRKPMLDWRYTLVDQIYDPNANQAKVAAAVNEGRGIINYIGHGSKTMWVSSRFGVADVAKLENGGGKWPMIWSVACVNGDFSAGSDCFAEAWAKAGTAADPRGAISIVAATTNMAWVPPCVWQKAIIVDYMIPELVYTNGAQHHYGCLKACEEYGYNDKSYGVQIIEQCVIFGDASVQVRNDIPRDVTVTVEGVTERGLSLKVLTGETPVKGARVVVSTELNGAMVGLTDAAGTVTLTAATGLTNVSTVAVTVTGPNLVPVIDQAVELPAK